MSATVKRAHNRFISVVAWSISTARPVVFGVAPYNSILGETHHVSRGSLNVLLEQVSHHPPVSALHATDKEENIEMIWCQNPVPKFYGILTSHCNLTLVSSNATRTQRTHSIRGRIYHSSSLETLYELEGHWNSIVTLKDINNGKETVIYNAKEVVSGLKTPIVKDPQGVLPSESAAVWSAVSEGILSKNWEKAREEKKAVEEKQRELVRDRNSRGQTWVPKYFNLSYNKEGGWDCFPTQKWVPPAPIDVPIGHAL
ncbi:hypothetical protein GH714_016562 [Hevea brasiliensis]|uniref:Oxysterol-binding protein n=1 Tax=Hevea brasiliensis TaxID=3981 RepID=A0A6A6MXQ1_HEVBR|nr:hypothetical protein GH714_016562 [Hevea brasiliensis]